MGRDPHPFYVAPSGFSPDGTVRFSEEEARHILRSIRKQPGDECRVVDGAGGLCWIRLEREGERLRGVVLRREQENQPNLRLDLGFPLLRLRSRTEWLLEKAVEVGVDRLIPIVWTRGLKKDLGGMRSRWERILREAMKQSERRWLPSLLEPETTLRVDDETDWIVADPGGGGESSPSLGVRPQYAC